MYLIPSDQSSQMTYYKDSIPWSTSTTLDGMTLSIKKWFGNETVETSSIEGFDFIIHATDELPSDSSNRFRQITQYTTIDIIPQQVLISDKLKHASFQQRNCYFKHEKPLEMFKVYSKSNCEHECQSFVFAEHCGCVPFYLLRSKMRQDKICDIQDKKCTDEVLEHLTEDVAKCNCLEGCEALSYKIILEPLKS